MNMIDRHNIRAGQIYIAADRSCVMMLVIDTQAFYDAEDVVAIEVTKNSVGTKRRIDAFKLAMCRYELYGTVPDWALAPLAAKLIA